ncbi:hypothetical protein PU629_20445 [Pullulanibacillus sp. KACC 23026]|nr:hypothetical protein [Pullulanibacillus sp. KACC 23026]WEG12439.1 hypothetical protein PU629_20445 [Pullulanibacillus sp. KACC 23026]
MFRANCLIFTITISMNRRQSSYLEHQRIKQLYEEAKQKCSQYYMKG